MKKIIALMIFMLIICMVSCNKDTSSNQENDHIHDFGEWIVTEDATCISKGVISRYCSCGEKQSDTVAFASHIVVIDNAVASTCTTKGLTEGKHCSVCEEVIIAQTETSALGHAMSEPMVENNVSATCTDQGSYDQVVYCLLCDVELSRDTVVLMPIDHDYVDGYCKNCGKNDGIERLAYKISEDGTYYIVTGIGTCTSDEIVIPSVYNGLPVTQIADRAFMNCTKLISVTIPETVTSIGEATFANCTNLAYVNIPNGVTVIKMATFACTKISEIVIPESVKIIEQDAFGHCYKIESITIPSSVIELDLYAFYYSAYLTDITFQGTIEQWNAINKTNVWEGVGIWTDTSNPVIICRNGVICITHTEVIDSYVTPTCTTKGLTEGKHCSVCEEVIVVQTEIGALGHTEEIDVAIDATCTTKGLTEGKHCSVCKEVIVAQTEIDIIGHNYVEDVCSFCKLRRTITIKEIRLNQETYVGKRVKFECVVVKQNGYTVYVEEYDPNADMYFGMQIFLGYGYPRLSDFAVGNKVSVVGTLQYYQAGNTYQVSNLQYDILDPNWENGCCVISTGNTVSYNEVDLNTLLNGKVTIEVPRNEDVGNGEVTETIVTEIYDYGQLALYSSATISHLKVVSVYTSSSGTITLTCEDENGIEIKIVTASTLYYQVDGTQVKVTAADFPAGTVISVKGVVDTYNDMYELRVFSYSDIVFE